MEMFLHKRPHSVLVICKPLGKDIPCTAEERSTCYETDSFILHSYDHRESRMMFQAAMSGSVAFYRHGLPCAKAAAIADTYQHSTVAAESLEDACGIVRQEIEYILANEEPPYPSEFAHLRKPTQ